MTLRVRIVWTRREMAALVVLAVLLVGLAVLGAGTASTAVPDVPASTDAVHASAVDPGKQRPGPSCPGATQRDRKAILVMIRDHRRAAESTWLEELTDTIYAESVRAEVDPLLVATIIAKESSFRTRAVSHAGAVGLMQVRPFVARDTAARLGVEWNGVDMLHEPRTNIRLGLFYYKRLIERFNGDEKVALTAYNFGPTRVARQLRRGTFSGSRYASTILDRYEELRENRGAAECGSRVRPEVIS